jgi:hypothetical protein
VPSLELAIGRGAQAPGSRVRRRHLDLSRLAAPTLVGATLKLAGAPLPSAPRTRRRRTASLQQAQGGAVNQPLYHAARCAATYLLWRPPFSGARFLRCVPSLRAGDRVLVTCVVTRRPFLARSGDLRTYIADLDNALVETEALTVGAAPHLLNPKQPWASALVALALSDVDMDRPGALAAAQLLANGRRPGTLRSYKGKFDRFFRFCTDIQIGQGFPALSPSSSVLLYLGWMQEEDKVHARSLQPCMSAINQAHVDFGFPPQAVGQLVRLACRGFGEVEGESSTSVRRVPLPAAVVMQILKLGLVTPSVPVLRTCACLVVQFLWFARADTVIHLRQGHVGIGAFGITLSERTKTITRHLAAPMTRPCLAAWDPEGLVLRLLRRWLHARCAVSDDAYFWTLPEEASPEAWTSALINA